MAANLHKVQKVILGIGVVGVMLVSVAQPAFAAENFLQKFGTSVSNRFQRLYLQLIPGNKPGEAIFRQVAAELPNIKSATTNTAITADLWQDEKNLANAKLTIVGPMEMSLSAEPRIQQSLQVGGEVTVQGTTMKANMDLRMTDKTIYFKINQVPALPLVDLSTLQGKWLKTSIEQSSQKEKTSLSPDQIERLQKAYQQLIASAKFDDASKETKNGKSVYVLTAHFSKDAIKTYVKEVMSVTRTSATNEDGGAAENRVMTSIDKVLNNAGDITAKLWVDRGTFYVRHLEMPLALTITKSDLEAQNTKAPLAALDNVNKISLLISVDMDSFNEPVKFEEPSDAQDAQQAFQELLSKGIGAGMGSPSSMADFGEGTAELPALTAKQKAQLKSLDAQKMKALQEQMKKISPTGSLPTSDPNLDLGGGEF